MEFSALAAKETSALLTRVLGTASQTSLKRVEALRAALETATKALEEAVASQPNLDRDVAQGVVLWSNERARASRVLPGLRYAAALSLCPGLHAGDVPDDDVRRAIDALTEALRFYTPDVEPSDAEPGVFWLGASGLSLLYPSLCKWAS